MPKYKTENLPKGRIKIYQIEAGEYGLVDVVLRPMNWDDKTFFAKANVNDKIKLCQCYARLLESWSLPDPVMATTLLDDNFVHLCTVVDACIKSKFLQPIEFFDESESS